MKQKNLRKREKTDLFKTNYKLCFPTANNLCKNPLIFVNSAEGQGGRTQGAHGSYLFFQAGR